MCVTSTPQYSRIYWDWFTTLFQSQCCRCTDLCSGGQISPSCSHMHASFPYAVLGWCQTLCRDWGLIRHGGPCHSTNQHRRDFCSFSVTDSTQRTPYARLLRALSATGEPRSAIGPSPCKSPQWWKWEAVVSGERKTQNRERGGFGSAIKLAACDCDSFDSQEESK